MSIRLNTLATASMAVMSLAAAGCVSIPKDRGATEIQPLLDARSGATAIKVEWGADRSRCSHALPAGTLTADAAVGIALRCSPKLQILYAELALTQADVYEATRLANPQLSFSWLSTGAPDDIVKTTWSISQRFVELLLLPLRQRIGKETLLATQQRAAHDVLELERSVRAAYVSYAAAAAIAEMQMRVMTAAELAAQTAEAFHAAGNINELQLSREQATAVEAKIEHGKARREAALARSELLSAIGVASQDAVAFAAPQSMATPATFAFDAESLRAFARAQRLDLQAARSRVSALDANVGQQSFWRWFGNFEVGYEVERETGEATRSGPTASIGLPLFNTRKDLWLRARGQLELAQVELRRLELELDNETEAALEAARIARDASQALRERLVPLRERITALSQREFNYMFIGTFELLAIKREEMAAYRQYLEAIRDEWLTQIELQRIAGGKLPPNAALTSHAGVQP